jgi:AcrR family transcriptional regulator
MEPDMPQKPLKAIRKPVQSRSIYTKEKIIDSALELFCEKGYYKTTTNEIAQRAQVSIGSLYSYFSDKDKIFFEILEKYHEKFETANSELINNPELLKEDSRAWFRALIENQIKVHEETKELNRELKVLSYYNPLVAEIIQKNRARTMKSTIGYFMENSDNLKPTSDIEAAATVLFDLISSTVDRIVFGVSELDRERLINMTVDILVNYFVI